MTGPVAPEDTEAVRAGQSDFEPALPLSWRAVIFAIVVVQFLVGHGPVWEHMFDWDTAIVASYVSIPILVLVALALKKRVALRPWAVHTIEIGAAKFFVTASVLGVLLARSYDSKRPFMLAPPPSIERTTAAKVVAPRPAPTVIAPETTGGLEGRVVDARGAAIADALVFVAAGLEGKVFAPPVETATITNDGRVITPAVGVVRHGQPVVARSANGELHTLWLRPHAGDTALINVSVLGSGVPVQVHVPASFQGVATIECAVHRAREGKAHVAVLDHPFVARTDAEGRFALKGVPAGAVKLAAFTAATGTRTIDVTVTAQQVAAIDVTIGQGP
ncbi:hypothetical protein L6R52_21820 [Myxococcota bacterium]|nr:hypothetical protein [Myxococcota bacterium]